MLLAMRTYIRVIDGFNRRLGRFIMYGIFAMVGILLWSSISKGFFTPSLWTLELAQFAMVAYYILGGPYAMQLQANVRMDLFYANWSLTKRAWVDAFTVFLLMFYLGVLLYGGLTSGAYSLGYFGMDTLSFYWDLTVAFVTGGPAAASEVMGFIERSPTAWRPYLWPIKFIMVFGFFLMLLQSVSELFKDIIRIKGEEI